MSMQNSVVLEPPQQVRSRGRRSVKLLFQTSLQIPEAHMKAVIKGELARLIAVRIPELRIVDEDLAAAVNRRAQNGHTEKL